MKKETLFAVLLIGVIFLLMQSDWYQQRAFPDMQRSDTTTPVESTELISPVTTDEGGKQQIPSVTPTGRETLQAAVPSGSLACPTDPALARTVEVRTDLYTARLSTLGATIIHFGLTQHKSWTGEEVVLLDGAESNLNPVFTIEGGRFDPSAYIFRSDFDRVDLRGTSGSRWVTFTLEEKGSGRKIRKSFLFRSDSYYIEVALDVVGFGNEFLYGTYDLNWSSPMLVTEPDTTQEMYYAEAMALMSGKNLDEYIIKKGPHGSQQTIGNVDWVAKRNKYFLAAIIPLSGKGKEVYYTGSLAKANGYDIRSYTIDLKLGMPNANHVSDSLLVYMGPLEHGLLKEAGVGLEKTVMTKATMGPMKFMWPVIKPFAFFSLWMFRLLNKVISNYGVIIIVFAFLIKLIVWPLTHKSYQSMKEMQRIQPLLKELKVKFKNDPRKAQMETMNVYKEHGVNPFGSCLPTLLQMPLLFALFIVFRSAFELRGASFIWPLTDLSQPDVLFNLPFAIPLYGAHVALMPILMGITTFFQTKMTATDPNQKMMVWFMPIFLVLLFNNFPSGLTLYYTLFNLLSILQQHWAHTPPKALATEKAAQQKRKSPPPTKRKRR
ncbi:MAG: membrane protein insertase YidC [Candidatus Delongbacteria bacterium]|nr:membrane protein insertase YidC [bacterium]MBL7033691.1 membrane protein insertase YidC [Candidatus Delongbacteria bacterium]